MRDGRGVLCLRLVLFFFVFKMPPYMSFYVGAVLWFFAFSAYSAFTYLRLGVEMEFILFQVISVFGTPLCIILFLCVFR